MGTYGAAGIVAGTSTNWATKDGRSEALLNRLPGFDTDTGVLKIGDGSALWSALPAINAAKVATIAALGSLDGASAPAGSMAFVDDYADAGDLGGGWFEARESAATVDNGWVFAHNSGGNFRWHRLLTKGIADVRHFGARGDGVQDDAANIHAAAGSSNRVVFPAGTYRTTIPLVPLTEQTWEGVHAWSDVEIVGDGVTGGIIQPNALYADAVKTRITIRGLKITGSADYGIRLINCTSSLVEHIRFNFGTTTNVSDLTYDCLYIGDSWEGKVSHISAYVETATVTPARSVIWLDGAMNGVLLDTIFTNAACQYGIHLSNTDAGGTEIPTAVTINNSTLQRQQIGVYAKRCRSVNASGLYFEGTQIPIRLGSDDSSSDRCAGFAVAGMVSHSLNGTAYGWADNSTGAIEAIRAYGCTFDGCSFSDYGAGTPHQMLYIKRCWGLEIEGPTRFNFAMSDMRPAISFDASWDTTSTFTITGNGTNGDSVIRENPTATLKSSLRIRAAAAPSSGQYYAGDVVDYHLPTAGGAMGAVSTADGSPGTWKEFGQVSS